MDLPTCWSIGFTCAWAGSVVMLGSEERSTLIRTLWRCWRMEPFSGPFILDSEPLAIPPACIRPRSSIVGEEGGKEVKTAVGVRTV